MDRRRRFALPQGGGALARTVAASFISVLFALECGAEPSRQLPPMAQGTALHLDGDCCREVPAPPPGPGAKPELLDTFQLVGDLKVDAFMEEEFAHYRDGGAVPCLTVDDGRARDDECLDAGAPAHWQLDNVTAGWHRVHVELRAPNDTATVLEYIVASVIFIDNGPPEKWPLDLRGVAPDYWRSICPDLHIAERWPSGWVNGSVELPEADLAHMRETLQLDGYFISPDDLEWGLPAPWSALADCVVRLRRHGWPGVFVLVFDETWAMLSRVHSIAAQYLGPNTVMMPNIWVHHVDASEEVGGAEPAGWKPHRDRPWTLKAPGHAFPDSLPHLTVWVPFTRAEPDNGAMYVLPKSLDPNVHDDGRYANSWEVFQDGRVDLRSVRAMPAVPGQVVGWDGEVAHWGARAQPDAREKRISMTLDFLVDHSFAKTIGSYVDRDQRWREEDRLDTYQKGVLPALGSRYNDIHVSAEGFKLHAYADQLPAEVWDYLSKESRRFLEARRFAPFGVIQPTDAATGAP